MEKKQNAVEWLEEQIKDIFYVAEASEMTKKFKSIYEQAKQMEKENVIHGYAVGHNDGCAYMYDGEPEFKNPEHYYNETYGGNDE